jgi:hypothetical protein
MSLERYRGGGRFGLGEPKLGTVSWWHRITPIWLGVREKLTRVTTVIQLYSDSRSLLTKLTEFVSQFLIGWFRGGGHDLETITSEFTPNPRGVRYEQISTWVDFNNRTVLPP